MKLNADKRSRTNRWITIVLCSAVASALAGCTAMVPQTAARNYAPLYYEGGYNSLSPQQKMHLEDHLTNQSNQAWRTTAQAAGGLGHLLGGTGTLVAAIRAHPARRHRL